jgi:hypothetical protein
MRKYGLRILTYRGVQWYVAIHRNEIQRLLKFFVVVHGPDLAELSILEPPLKWNFGPLCEHLNRESDYSRMPANGMRSEKSVTYDCSFSTLLKLFPQNQEQRFLVRLYSYLTYLSPRDLYCRQS